MALKLGYTDVRNVRSIVMTFAGGEKACHQNPPGSSTPPTTRRGFKMHPTPCQARDIRLMGTDDGNR